jgi:predicted  nucleic acid-binding Zn-ribbon protein
MSETEKNIEEIQKAIEDLQAKDISLSSTDQDFEQRITYTESAIDV